MMAKHEGKYESRDDATVARVTRTLEGRPAGGKHGVDEAPKGVHPLFVSLLAPVSRGLS